MTIKTPAEIAAQAARDLLAAHDLKQEYVNENPLESLGWEMGEGIGYVAALGEMVQRVLELDRAQRPQVKLGAAEEVENLRHIGYSDSEIVAYLARTNPGLAYMEERHGS